MVLVGTHNYPWLGGDLAISSTNHFLSWELFCRNADEVVSTRVLIMQHVINYITFMTFLHLVLSNLDLQQNVRIVHMKSSRVKSNEKKNCHFK